MPFSKIPGVTTCYFKKGEYLIRAGEAMEYVYYLKKGSVEREMVTASGRESILSNKSSNGIIHSLVGILILYRKDREGIARNDFIAKTDCVCYKVPAQACKDYLRQHPELLEETLAMAMEEYAAMETRFMAKHEKNAAAQLCQFLLNHATCSCEEEPSVLSKKYTNVEISKYLSIHAVTVARILRALKEEGVVNRTEHGLMILDRVALAEYANEERLLQYH